MCPAPRPVVFLLCCVSLASVGAIGNRKEEGANADTVTVRAGRLSLWPPGLSCRQVYREIRGCLCLEEGCVSGLDPSEPRRAPRGITSVLLLSWHHRSAPAPETMEGVSEKYP